jgi:hypothetical protein
LNTVWCSLKLENIWMLVVTKNIAAGFGLYQWQSKYRSFKDHLNPQYTMLHIRLIEFIHLFYKTYLQVKAFHWKASVLPFSFLTIGYCIIYSFSFTLLTPQFSEIITLWGVVSCSYEIVLCQYSLLWAPVFLCFMA